MLNDKTYRTNHNNHSRSRFIDMRDKRKRDNGILLVYAATMFSDKPQLRVRAKLSRL